MSDRNISDIKNISDKKQKLQEFSRRHTSRRGAYSAAMTAMAVAIVIIFNIIMGYLPDTSMQFDLTDSGIYDITDTSRDYLAALDKDILIHVMAAEESVDTRITRFLSYYKALSKHIRIEYTDPIVFPSVPASYGVEAGTVVVTCEETARQESFAIDDIIGYDLMSYYYYGVRNETDFDAEGLLTAAVDGVVSDVGRTGYEISGHGETALSTALLEQLRRAHLTVNSVNLLTEGGVPGDCGVLILNAPVRDLANDELTWILDYLAAGGQVIYSMASQIEPLPNLEKLCAFYGLQVEPGIIADMERYYSNNPAMFFPVPDTSVDVAQALSHDNLTLFYASRGMTMTTPARDSITAQAFLSTSRNAYAVQDENTQAQGEYIIAALATEEIPENEISESEEEKLSENQTARLTVIGSPSLTDENLNGSFTNLANRDVFIAIATEGFSELPDLSIEPVSLEMPMNTIATGGLWALVFILVIPLALFVSGFIRWMRRRKL